MLDQSVVLMEVKVQILLPLRFDKEHFVTLSHSKL